MTEVLHRQQASTLLKKKLSQEILHYLDLSIEQFAPICDTTDRFPIAASAAARYGLNETVEIMCGASDGCLAAYAGYVSTGIKNSLTIGTSAAVRKVTDQPVFDQRQNFVITLKRVNMSLVLRRIMGVRPCLDQRNIGTRS